MNGWATKNLLFLALLQLIDYKLRSSSCFLLLFVEIVNFFKTFLARVWCQHFFVICITSIQSVHLRPNLLQVLRLALRYCSYRVNYFNAHIHSFKSIREGIGAFIQIIFEAIGCISCVYSVRLKLHIFDLNLRKFSINLSTLLHLSLYLLT